MPRRIGVVTGDDDSFAEKLLERLAEERDLEVELASIGGTPERFVCRYDVLVDRMSHRVPHYRAYLKAARTAGTRVINDPFNAGDKFVALSRAAQLGVPTARAVLLPQKRYGAGIAPERALKNLEYPLNWNAIVEYVTLPATLSGIDGNEPVPVRDLDELMRAYDATGEQVMMLVQRFDGPRVVCVCIGECVVPLDMEGDRAQVEESALAASRGLDVNTVEMAVADGVAYVVDARNPAPNLARELIGDRAFERVVEAMVGLVRDAAYGA